MLVGALVRVERIISRRLDAAEEVSRQVPRELVEIQAQIREVTTIVDPEASPQSARRSSPAVTARPTESAKPDRDERAGFDLSGWGRAMIPKRVAALVALAGVLLLLCAAVRAVVDDLSRPVDSSGQISPAKSRTGDLTEDEADVEP